MDHRKVEQMTYHRVMPRDLFNEANLLKCYGQLWLKLDEIGLSDLMKMQEYGNPFEVYQARNTGNTSAAIHLENRHDRTYFYRPLNSREPYPLYAEVGDDAIPVFEDDGEFTEEFKTYLKGLNE